MVALVYYCVCKRPIVAVAFDAPEEAAVDPTEQDASKDIPRNTDSYFVDDIDEHQVDPIPLVSL